MMIRIMMLLWAATSSMAPLEIPGHPKEQADVVIGVLHYAELCDPPVPSALAEWTERAAKKIDFGLLKAQDADMTSTVKEIGSKKFCELLTAAFKRFG